MGDTAATFRVSATAYDRYVGRYGPDLAAGLIAAAGVGPGMRVLDVGCGPGALAAALAGVVGEDSVAAVDPSETFVAACRERLPRADVRLATAEDLPFDDDSFDATLAQLVVNFMRDPPAGVREMVRVTRRAGRVAACVWDYGEGMTLMRAFWDAALELDPDAPDEGRAMPYRREGELAALLERVGLRDVIGSEVIAHASYESFGDLVAPLASGIGPAGAHYASLEPEGRARLEEGLRSRLEVGEKPFRLSARAWLAVGSV